MVAYHFGMREDNPHLPGRVVPNHDDGVDEIRHVGEAAQWNECPPGQEGIHGTWGNRK